jgi:hypothetical protein
MSTQRTPRPANVIKGIKGFISIPLLLRVASNIDLPDGLTGCWVWINPGNRGYGSVRINGKHAPSHKALFEHANGPIHAGFELDHLCKNKACCNPDHLEIVTHKENNKRDPGAWKNKEKTHCLRGHPLSGDNLYVTNEGYRQCKECAALRHLKFRTARAAIAKATQ